MILSLTQPSSSCVCAGHRVRLERIASRTPDHARGKAGALSSFEKRSSSVYGAVMFTSMLSAVSTMLSARFEPPSTTRAASRISWRPSWARATVSSLPLRWEGTVRTTPLPATAEPSSDLAPAVSPALLNVEEPAKIPRFRQVSRTS